MVQFPDRRRARCNRIPEPCGVFLDQSLNQMAEREVNERIGLKSTIRNSDLPLRCQISRFENGHTVPTC